MWCVSRPTFGALESFAECISRIQNPELKLRLQAIADVVVSEAAEYVELAEAGELHLMGRMDSVGGNVTVDEMVALYDQRMAGKAGPGRFIYDAIKALPRYGVCPLCDHRPVSTLDHILPKRRFPALTVAPDNLVGACADCNKLKLSFYPEALEDVLLHPYFDSIENERWLKAQVIEGPVAAVTFRAERVVVWSNSLNERLQRQFRLLGLGHLYGAQAAREVSGQARLLSDIHRGRGAEGVRTELMRQAESREAVRLNSWQAATYRALGSSDWFCDGGFRRR